MKQVLSIVVFCFLFLPIHRAGAADITTLLDAASVQPGVAVSKIAVQESAMRESSATAALFPKLDLYGRAETYNSPTNLRPMSPTEVNVSAGESIPFSRNILRYGLHLEMPLYVRQIYLLRQKMHLLTQGAELVKTINLVSRQSAVVSLNSAFEYLVNLNRAIDSRLKSLKKTRSDITLKVKNGRTPAAELMKINNFLIALEQQQNELTVRMLDVKRDLNKLTGLVVAAPVSMTRQGDIKAGPFIAVRKDKKEVAAAEKEVARRRAARYPALSLYGTVSGNDGEAYNTEEHISRSYNFAGLVLKLPLFDMTLSTDERIAGLQLEKARKKLEDTLIELKALAINLRDKIPVIEHSLVLAVKSAGNNEQLLAIAKVAYDSGRMTTEEYLRYESRLLDSQAMVNKARDQRWQITARQAILYGIDLKGVVK